MMSSVVPARRSPCTPVTRQMRRSSRCRPSPSSHRPGTVHGAHPSGRRGMRGALVAALALALFSAGVLVGQGGHPVAMGVAAAPDASAAASHQPGGPGSVVPDGAPEDFGVFWEALKLVQDRYVDPSQLGDENLTWGAIRGMVEALGDTGHTVFLTPDQVQAEIRPGVGPYQRYRHHGRHACRPAAHHLGLRWLPGGQGRPAGRRPHHQRRRPADRATDRRRGHQARPRRCRHERHAGHHPSRRQHRRGAHRACRDRGPAGHLGVRAGHEDRGHPPRPVLAGRRRRCPERADGRAGPGCHERRPRPAWQSRRSRGPGRRYRQPVPARGQPRSTGSRIVRAPGPRCRPRARRWRRTCHWWS